VDLAQTASNSSIVLPALCLLSQVLVIVARDSFSKLTVCHFFFLKSTNVSVGSLMYALVIIVVGASQ
jgi:thiol:disulfide interchange protein